MIQRVESSLKNKITKLRVASVDTIRTKSDKNLEYQIKHDFIESSIERDFKFFRDNGRVGAKIHLLVEQEKAKEK